ncbi:hypothetical protein [Hymenobacter bucti]|uniref:Uncharacterized protein n=1 Tax=Hymenobacter bucti TaxID=1844114 RepID=A0ABW4QTD3_9BACT
MANFNKKDVSLNKYSKEADVAVLRSIFSLVPYVGAVLNEVVFDIRGRVKQERLNKFTEMFGEYFTNRPDFDTDVLKTEDFGDLFEGVMRNVVQTKSEAKYRRYKDILINKIENKNFDTDNTSRFLELIASLDEIEIIILSYHEVFDNKFMHDKDDFNYLKNELESLKQQLKEEIKLSLDGSANSKDRVQDELEVVEKRVDNYKMVFDELEIYNTASFYKVSDSQLIYHKQNLYSKALLIDITIGTYGYVPFARMGITEFGKGFLQFLRKSA